MCGIAGAFSSRATPAELSAAVGRMQHALRHRGPDGEGHAEFSNPPGALGHVRLSIIDLSEAAAQPMRSDDGRWMLVFNGEIYNYRALRKALESGGAAFRTQSDSEVLLHLVATRGPAALREARGMFAFALWDSHEKRLFLARDGLGIKPLYFAELPNNGVAFASELRAFAASRLLPLEPDPAAALGFLETGSVPEPLTLWRGIRALEPGHWREWTPATGLSAPAPFWTLRFPEPSVPAGDAAAHARAALVDSVAHHFVADVPVGLFLSGGLDSSAVLALARVTQHGRLRTFSIGFEEQEWNEAPVAERVARHFDAEHTEWRLTAREAQELFPEYLAAVDQPTIDGFNTWCVSRMAHRAGMKVVLSGLGGDELLGGYASFLQVPRLSQVIRAASILGPVAHGAGALFESLAFNARIRRFGAMLQTGGDLRSVHRLFRGIFSPREARMLVNAVLGNNRTSPPETRPTPLPVAPTAGNGISYLELTTYMRNQLLRDSDVFSMAHSLELRVPLVDTVLFDALAAIPASARLQPGKGLLRAAVPELPDWLLRLPKRGFLFPWQQWFDAGWTDAIPVPPTPRGVPLRPWYRHWAVGMLAEKTRNRV